MDTPLLVDVNDGVGLVTFNRPGRLNAITADMGVLFEEAMVRLSQDDAVRAIVITGAGRGFCAGADVERLDDLAIAAKTSLQGKVSVRPGEPQPILDALADADPAFRSRYLAPMAVPKPVIGIVNGPCAGIGLALAVACDLRFASELAVFTAMFPRRGLVAEGALAWTLPPLVGYGVAADILMSGRRVDAQEALRIGLVNAVHPPGELMSRSMAYARDLAQNCSPRSLRMIKRQLQAARSQSALEAARMSYDETLLSLASADFLEGKAAFKEARAPQFVGR